MLEPHVDESGWFILPSGAHTHVVPLNDTDDHVVGDAKCPCGAEYDEEHNRIIHVAFDGRKPFNKKLGAA